MAQAKEGTTVKVHYTGKLEDGTVFDSSSGGEPIEFTLGSGQLIPGFEQAVLGMNPGEQKTVRISPENAYGPHHPELEVVVGREQFPENLEPEIGQQLQVRQQDGPDLMVTITEINDSNVTLDANHPLAGRELIFDIEVLEVA